MMLDKPLSLLDHYQNDPVRANFENELARALIDTASRDVLVKLNHVILDYLERSQECFDEQLLPIVTEIKTVLSAKILDLCACVNAYKLFFEPNHIFQPSSLAYLDLKHTKEPVNNLRDLATKALAQKATQGGYSKGQAFYGLLNNEIMLRLRPHSQFSEENRARKFVNDKGFTSDFGITDSKYTPEWAKNYHAKPINSAKNQYEFANSDLVNYFRKNRIPLVSGPSGTLTYIISGIIQLGVLLSVEETREVVALLTAAMIAEGHHSVAEVMMVAANFNLYKTYDAHAQPMTIKFPFIDPDNFYMAFLPDSFKKTDDYQKLRQHYPQYLARSIPVEQSLTKEMSRLENCKETNSQKYKLLSQMKANLKEENASQIAAEFEKLNHKYPDKSITALLKLSFIRTLKSAQSFVATFNANNNNKPQ